MADTEEQLRALNLRLTRLEDAVISLTPRGPSARTPAPLAPSSVPNIKPSIRARIPQDVEDDFSEDPLARSLKPQSAQDNITVTQIMGWTGVTLLVLAAAYLIRLVYDAGWLTPNRQLLLAVLSGVALIAAGLKLRRRDNHYASLLPAGGLVVLFLAIYGAHLYHHLIGAGAATTTVIANCLLALWLGRIFASEIYGLFAVVGSYSAPILLPVLSGSVVDLAIYFTAWSVVFCIYAVAIQSRRPYLLAAYMALLAFQFLWQKMDGSHWGAAGVFQTLQFSVFLIAAIVFSIRHARPMTQAEGIAHLPLLLLFYALQYALLHQHAPDIAPWVALGSAAVLLLAYGIAKLTMAVSLEAGGLIVGSYCALVLFHAGYLQLLPEHWAPWAVLIVLPLGALYATRSSLDSQFMLPFKILLGGLFALNYLRLGLMLIADHSVAGNTALVSFLYAVELYAAYFVGRSRTGQRDWVEFALYAAHIGLMFVALRTLDKALLGSLSWGLLALATLVLAFKLKDQVLGKSSLLVFAASITKMILFDLSGAAPVLRIGSLVVAGVSLYVGGILYKRVIELETIAAKAEP